MVAPGQWPGGQEDDSATVVRGGFQGSSCLSTDMEVFQYFNNRYSCRMNMGPLQCEYAFPGEFTLCLVLWLNLPMIPYNLHKHSGKCYFKPLFSDKEILTLYKVTMVGKW